MVKFENVEEIVIDPDAVVEVVDKGGYVLFAVRYYELHGKGRITKHEAGDFTWVERHKQQATSLEEIPLRMIHDAIEKAMKDALDGRWEGFRGFRSGLGLANQYVDQHLRVICSHSRFRELGDDKEIVCEYCLKSRAEILKEAG